MYSMFHVHGTGKKTSTSERSGEDNGVNMVKVQAMSE